MIKSIDEINDRIARGRAHVIRADEMTRLVREEGVAAAARTVDVVTTGTFGPMCSSGVMMNFGHSNPPIRMSTVSLNGVYAHTGLAAVDAYLGATQPSKDLGNIYGGAHVIEDLVQGLPIRLLAESSGTDCYPGRRVHTTLRLSDLNHALMLNPRNAYQRYNAAINTGSETMHTYMGTLRPDGKNINWSGAGELSPLSNDPRYRFIGAGTRIFLGGGEGMVTGPGTQHDPDHKMATLSVQGDLFQMKPEFLRAASFTGYGCTLFIGIGIPIPIVDEEAAFAAGISDKELETDILDFFQPGHPAIRRVTYADLKSGTIDLGDRRVPSFPLSSPLLSRRVAESLKTRIRSGNFTLSLPVSPLPDSGLSRELIQRTPVATGKSQTDHDFFDIKRCVHCGQCVVHCPGGVFSRDGNDEVRADPQNCTNCGRCEKFCPVSAIHPKGGGAS